MNGFEPEIPVAIVVAVILATVSFRRFRRTSFGPPCAILATYALVVGTLVALAGVAHTVAVAVAARGKPYDSRLAFLLTTGGILVFWGTINAALSPLLNRGFRWSAAIVGATVCALIAFLFLLIPLPSAGSSVRSLFVLAGVYLLLLLWFWVALRRQRVSGVPPVA